MNKYFTISIQEAMALFPCSDQRTLFCWCRKRGIKIYSQENGRYKYLIRKVFEYQFLRDFIEDLQLEYGEYWVEAYKLLQQDTAFRIAYKEHQSEKPSSDNEQEFITEKQATYQ